MPNSSIPKHIALILDGNRRWARQHKLEVIKGHEIVADKVIENLVENCIDRGVEYITLWAFSTENWKRDQSEVSGLMDIFRRGLARSAERLHKKGVKINVIGDMSRFPQDIQENAKKWIADSENNTRITLTFALNYGGRDEILRATKRIVEKAVSGEIKVSEIDEELFSSYLDTASLPDPDLLIRPGGEQRLSGYLPWQTTYTELYFTPVLMPDFDAAELDKALADFSQRQRRFGG